MTPSKTSRRFGFAVGLGVVTFLAPATLGLQGDQDEPLIVECTRPCAAVTAAVSAVGGQVTYRYDNIDAVAVRIPKGRVADLMQVAGPGSVSKDALMEAPRPTEVVDAGQPVGLVDLREAGPPAPANYNHNNALTGAAVLHAAGKRGQGIVVGVIDSGTANVPMVPALAGSVIGGETFVPAATDPLSATHRENDWHGTAVGEMIAAHVAFIFLTTQRIVQSLNLHAPGSAFPCPAPFVDPCTATRSLVPMTGTAPGALLYAMKVFPASGDSAPESRVIAAMDRAITLRRNFDAGMASMPVSGDGSEERPFVYNSLKIDVVNMSLGGSTLFAGRSFFDQLTLEMLEAGITLVVSAGNDGFGALTGGSPGTGFGALTVGAATTAAHERVLRDNQFGLGIGALYRPTTHTQTAYFSSRGPTADGRIDPDLSANGFASYVHAMVALTAAGQLVECRGPGAVPGTCVPRILFVSGTSFASPTVAGAAALLKRESPSSRAIKVRNALQFSANPAIFGDDSGPIDRGEGFLDVPAALQFLLSGKVSGKVPDLERNRHRRGEDLADDLGKGGRSVALNVMKAGFRPITFVNDRFSTTVQNLRPGQVAQFFVPSDPWTSRLVVNITGITPELPPDEQNPFFGDDIFFTIIDAPTSFAVERASDFIVQDTTIDVDHPQTGLVRVALQGDWTNAGRVSASVTITRQRSFSGFPTAFGIVSQDQVIPIQVDVPTGVTEAVFETAWLQNWSRYPTNDVDMILVDPLGNEIETGATENSPERVAIANPTGGRWTARIIGLTIFRHDGKPDDPDKLNGRHDLFTFQAKADGRMLKARRH
jgi:subtilisin family serine protease